MSTKKSFVKTRKNLICGVIAMSMLGASASMLMTGCGSSIDLTNHLDYYFYESSLYDGHIRMDVKVDYSEVGDEYASVLNEKDTHRTELTAVLDNANVTAVTDGKKTETTTVATENPEEGVHTISTARLEDLSETDTVSITVSWDKDEKSLEEIKAFEEKSGLHFDTSDKTVKVKVADALKKEELEVKKTAGVDIINEIIKPNNLVYSEGIKNGSISVGIGPFSQEVSGFEILHQSGSEIEIKSKGLTIGEVSIEFSEKSRLSEGDEVKISIEETNLEEYGIFIKGGEMTYTVTKGEGVDAETAKGHTGEVEQRCRMKISENASDYDNVSIDSIYCIESKNADENYIVAIFKYDSTLYNIENRYKCFEMEDVYLVGGEYINCCDTSISYLSYNSAESLKKDTDYFNDSNYIVTKIS